MEFLSYLSDVVHEFLGRSQVPCTLLPVPGSVSFLVIEAIVFSISDIMNFKVTVSASAGLFDLFFLKGGIEFLIE